MTETIQQAPRRRRPFRTFIKLVVCLVIIVAVLVALAPTFINMGLGHGAIASAVSSRLNGSASFAGLRVGWFGSQSIDQLVIQDQAGKEVARLDAELRAGLLDLALGKTTGYDASISGSISSELRADGSTSLAEILPPAEPESAAPPAPSARPTSLPPVHLSVDGLTIKLMDTVAQRPLTIENLRGTIDYAPSGDVAAKLSGGTVADQLKGTIALDAVAKRLIDSTGKLTPGGATADLSLQVTEAPVLLADRDEVIESLNVRITSTDLTADLALVASAAVLIPGQAPGALAGDLAVASPFSRDGSPTISLDKISGHVTAKSIPTALAQPWLAATPIIASRELGAFVDLEARFGAGETKQITLNLASPTTSAELAGAIDPAAGTLRGEKLVLKTTLHPDLLAGAGSVRIDDPLQVEANLTQFELPPLDKLADELLTNTKAAGTISLIGHTKLHLPLETWPEAVFGGALAEFSTASPAESVEVRFEAAVDDMWITGRQTITGLVSATGELAAANAMPVGAMKIEHITPAILTRVASAQTELIRAAALSPLVASITTTNDAGDLRAAIDVQPMPSVGTAPVTATADLTRRSDRISLHAAGASMTITPELAAAAQKESAAPIMLTHAAPVQLALEPWEIPVGSDGALDLAANPLKARITSPNLGLDKLPGLAQPILVQDFDLAAQARLTEKPVIAAAVTGKLHRAADHSLVSNFTTHVEVDQSTGRTFESADVQLANLSVPGLEAILGRPAQSLSKWTGAGGSVRAVVSPIPGGNRALVTSNLANLTGRYDITMDERFITVASSDAKLVMDQPAVQNLLAPPTPEQPQPGMVIESGLTITPTITTCRIPVQFIRDEPIDPAHFDLDVKAATTPLAIRDASGLQATLSDVLATVSTSDLREGIAFTLASDAREASAADQPAKLNVNGKLTQLLTADSRFSMADPRLEMTATASGIATAIADGLAGLEGLLVAAIGQRTDASIIARDFSSMSGHLTADLRADNAWLKAQAAGRDQAMHITPDAPATAELALTPPLRERILARINPILGDVRTTQQPIRAVVSAADIPMNGDVSKLNADLEITIGEVELDSGSTILAVLKILNTSRGAQVKGYIEPIRAQIRNGIVTYPRFAMKLDKYVLVYSGQVDLNTSTVDLRTEVPGEALASTFHELKGIADNAIIPIRTRGKFGALKTEPDFSGLAESVADDLIKKGIGELLKGIGK